MKKVFNWFGFAICTAYIFIDIISWLLIIYMSFSPKHSADDAEFFSTIAVGFLIFMPFLLPRIWNKTFKYVLPVQCTRATLINKQQETLSKYARGLYFVKEIYILTFETFDGVRKTFCVEAKNNPQIFYNLSNETGTLCYKEQGKHIHFVSFTPDSTGQPIS